MVTNDIFFRNVDAIHNKYFNTNDFFDISKELSEKASKGDGSTDIMYPTSQFASEWADNFREQVIDRTFYLIGFSDGQFISHLLDVTNSTNIIYVYEPSLRSFLYVLNTYDLTSVLSDKRLAVCVEGINGDSIFDIIVTTVNYSNYRLIMMGVLPGYDNYVEQYNKVKSILQYRMEMVEFEKTTDMELAKVARQNELKNLPDAVSQRSINQLAERFAEINKSGSPAIIVSAGPSLDKNITELKHAEGRAFIIVVDTALKAVLRAGIKPDITVCIDPCKEIVFFKHEAIKNVPAVFGIDIPSDVIKDHEGSRFYIGSDESDILDSFRREFKGENYMTLSAGGSVANVAYSLAVKLGFTTIILVGQDLAFTDGKGHTKDAYDDDKKNISDATDNRYICEVEAVGGGMVKTEVRMRSYIQWFENSIKSMPQIDVIDATEGGALIHGSRIMTLKEAIETECTGGIIDYRNIIEEIKPEFTDDEKKDIDNYLKNIDGELDRLSHTIENGIAAYEQLRIAIDSKSQSMIKSSMEIIKKVNRLEEDEPLMSLVMKYTVEDKYAVKDELYDSAADDTESAIRGGIKLLRSYMRGIENMKTETYLMTEQL